MPSKVTNSDMTMDELEETRFKKKNLYLTQKLTEFSHFDFMEAETLLLIYFKLTRDGPMDRKRFRDILHTALDMTGSTLSDRIFVALNGGKKLAISMETWVMALSLLLRGSLDERIDYCFEVYDLHGDGIITKDIMFILMKKSLIKQSQDEDADEGIRDLVDVIHRRMDHDRDGKVTYNDFKNCCLKSPLMVEALGECLPSMRAAQAFLTSFTPRSGVVRTCSGKE